MRGGIVNLAMGLGFAVGYPHNKAHILVESEEKIKELSTRAGFSTSFYFDAAKEILVN